MINVSHVTVLNIFCCRRLNEKTNLTYKFYCKIISVYTDKCTWNKLICLSTLYVTVSVLCWILNFRHVFGIKL